MGMFEKKKERPQQKRTPQDYDKKQDRLERKKAWDSFVDQMKKDPELEREFAFKKMGITPPKQTDPSERKKQELRSVLMDEAIKTITGDPELKKLYTEAMVQEVIGRKMPTHRNGDGEIDEGLYMEQGSGIEHALAEVEGLAELRAKLADLGLIDGGKKGFFDGITLKDLLGVVAMLKGDMGGSVIGEQHRLPPENRYVVQVNGKQISVNESTYQRMLSEGKIRPVAAELEAPKTEESVDETIQPVVSSEVNANEQTFNLPPLDVILKYVDMETIQDYIYRNPDEIVDELKKKFDEENEVAQFVWGLLTNTTYEGLMVILKQYRDDDRTKSLFLELDSEAGKQWVDMVLEKVREKSNAKQ